MGLPSHTLPRRVREAAGLKLAAGGHAAVLLAEPLVGHCLIELAMTPPTVTHHDKQIVRRGGRLTLIDSDELVAARAAYEKAIPPRVGTRVTPVASPIVLRVTFRFPLSGMRTFEHWHVQKPDLDNQVKLLKDVLAGRGYLADDKHVALEVLAKRQSPTPGIQIYLRTLLGPDDTGPELQFDPDQPAGVVHELPAAARFMLCPSQRVHLGERPIHPKDDRRQA